MPSDVAAGGLEFVACNIRAPLTIYSNITPGASLDGLNSCVRFYASSSFEGLRQNGGHLVRTWLVKNL